MRVLRRDSASIIHVLNVFDVLDGKLTKIAAGSLGIEKAYNTFIVYKFMSLRPVRRNVSVSLGIQKVNGKCSNTRFLMMGNVPNIRWAGNRRKWRVGLESANKKRSPNKRVELARVEQLLNLHDNSTRFPT